MAYNVANNLRVVMPDPIGVDQLKRKNALADVQMQQEQQRNALYGRQIAQNDARLKADEQAAALERVRAWAPGAIEQARAGRIAPFVIEGQRLGVIDPARDPRTVTPDEIEEFATQLGIAPKAKPEPITAQTIDGFRVLKQGDKIVPGGVQAPERPQAATPVKPNWTKVDQRMPDGTVQSGVIDMNAPDPTATFKAMGAQGKAGADESRTFARADKLRDEFNAASKELVTVGDNYAKIQEVSADNSAAGDLSLIFSYMKMLDPNSVVREQEFANAQNAAGVPDRIRAAYNKVISGERLSPNQRADFIKQAGNVYNAQKKRHESTVVKRYTAMAKRWNIDPQDVIGDLSVTLPNSGGGSASSAGGVPADVDAILKKYSK